VKLVCWIPADPFSALALKKEKASFILTNISFLMKSGKKC
jgi:hypothetical protein